VSSARRQQNFVVDTFVAKRNFEEFKLRTWPFVTSERRRSSLANLLLLELYYLKRDWRMKIKPKELSEGIGHEHGSRTTFDDGQTGGSGVSNFRTDTVEIDERRAIAGDPIW
jgi:hypothetical protein